MFDGCDLTGVLLLGFLVLKNSKLKIYEKTDLVSFFGGNFYCRL